MILYLHVLPKQGFSWEDRGKPGRLLASSKSELLQQGKMVKWQIEWADHHSGGRLGGGSVGNRRWWHALLDALDYLPNKKWYLGIILKLDEFHLDMQI